MILTLSRPAKALSDPIELENEYRAARWAHHRLLDFEDQHQALLTEVAEACAPGISRVGSILARLARHERRRKHSPEGTWAPRPRPELTKQLKLRLADLRKVRNSDPRWKVALGWADEKVGQPKKPRRRRAKDPSQVKRKKSESDEAFAKRFKLLTTDESDEHYEKKLKSVRLRTRREEYRKSVYDVRRCYHGTWNAIVKSVDQARAAVLKARKEGYPASWKHPRWDDSISLAADSGGFRIIERGDLWWIVEIRLGTETGKKARWARFRAKCGNWHDIDESATFKTVKVTRRKDCRRWSYALNISVKGMKKKGRSTIRLATDGLVAFDWGHREHGHPSASSGIRAFVWIGDDGRKGEILLPPECRRCQDEIDALKSRLDETFNARRKALGLSSRNRHAYRKKLLRSGVRTEEESLWLKWETRYERRIIRRRKRSKNLRNETYLAAVRELRALYSRFAFEGESNADIKEVQKEEHMKRRARANRDLTARYEFVTICERYGAEIVPVSARNTTRECPSCGHQDENTAELLIACSGCGTVRDKDHGAARVILARADKALANHAAE